MKMIPVNAVMVIVACTFILCLLTILRISQITDKTVEQIIDLYENRICELETTFKNYLVKKREQDEKNINYLKKKLKEKKNG